MVALSLPYENTREEFDIQGYAISLEDMANTTHTVFYAQRRKAPPAAHVDAATALAGDGGALPQL